MENEERSRHFYKSFFFSEEVGAAEFEVKCESRPLIDIVLTNDTTKIVLDDGSDSPFTVAAIDDSSVTLKNSLGTEVVFRSNQFVYNGYVESEECELKVTSTDLGLANDVSKQDILQRIESLEQRVMELENVH